MFGIVQQKETLLKTSKDNVWYCTAKGNVIKNFQRQCLVLYSKRKRD